MPDLLVIGGIAIPEVAIIGVTDLNAAEKLIELAEFIKSDPGNLIIIDRPVSAKTLSMIKVALDFVSKVSPAIRMRAMIEDWSYDEVVRSIY